MAFINSSNKSALEMLIRNGVACDGTTGDELLARLEVKGIWPLHAFGVKAAGEGVRFKVKGQRYSGDVAIRAFEDGAYHVMLVRIDSKVMTVRSGKMTEVIVPNGAQLTAVLSAMTDDVNAEIV